jgi:subtilisin family serine protease
MFVSWLRTVPLAACTLAILPAVCDAVDLATHTREIELNGQTPPAPKARTRIKSSMRRPTDAPAAAASKLVDLSIINLEFVDEAACQAFTLPGTKVFTRFQNFADIFVGADGDGNVDPAVIAALDKLKADKKLAWYELTGDKLVPPAPRVVPTPGASRALVDEIVRGGYQGLTGRGVILAVVDSGIDFRHPDFVTYDAVGVPTSRILFFWDTLSEAYANGIGSPAPISYPNGASIGTVYSQTDLTAELRGTRPRINEFDTMGHGTGCAGVAAGNGNASQGKYAGVAPQVDIIAVRIGGHAGGESLENASLLGAICGWLDEKAGSKPLVVSCSFGGQYGGRDGYLVEERQISARFAPDTRGRAICIAAGNDAEYAIHASLQLKGTDAPAKLLWSSAGGADIELYLRTADDSDISLRTPPTTKIKLTKDFIHPLTNQVIVQLHADSGPGELSLFSKSGKPIGGDAYISGDSVRFTSGNSSDRQIGAPGAAAQAITVGSYDFNDKFNTEGRDVTLPDVESRALTIGQVSSYSNPGPRRLGDGADFGQNLVKPDIVSPGEWHITPTPLNVVPTFMRDSTGYYQNFNGTSAATPYTAGVVALLFEKQPSLTAGQVRDLLHDCAQHDAFTQKGTEQWGYGKLNLQAVDKLLASPGK